MRMERTSSPTHKAAHFNRLHSRARCVLKSSGDVDEAADLEAREKQEGKQFNYFQSGIDFSLSARFTCTIDSTPRHLIIC